MDNERHNRDRNNEPGMPRVTSARTVQNPPMLSAMIDVAIAKFAGAARWLRLEVLGNCGLCHPLQPAVSPR